MEQIKSYGLFDVAVQLVIVLYIWVTANDHL